MAVWWSELLAIERVLVVIAFPFTVLTVFSLIMEIIGASSHAGSHDTDISQTGDLTFHDGSVGFLDHFSFFSVRNLIYFMMMFGWTGLTCSKSGFPPWLTILLGILAGLLTTVIIGWIFYLLSRLTESGNLKMKNAVGKTATVYLSIPASRSGTGIVQVVMQGVTQELNAVTDGEKLSTGASVHITELLDGNIVLVAEPDKPG